MDEDEVDITMAETDPSGQIEKYTIQTGKRVKIPDNWLEFLDLDEGDDVIVKCEDDSVVIKEWNNDNLRDI